MSEAKQCTKCGNKLRSDNTGTECSYCKKGLRSPAAGGEAQKAGGKRPASETLKRFRTVAIALGKDPDAILEEAAKEWLSVLEKAAE